MAARISCALSKEEERAGVVWRTRVIFRSSPSSSSPRRIGRRCVICGSPLSCWRGIEWWVGVFLYSARARRYVVLRGGGGGSGWW